MGNAKYLKEKNEYWRKLKMTNFKKLKELIAENENHVTLPYEYVLRAIAHTRPHLYEEGCSRITLQYMVERSESGHINCLAVHIQENSERINQVYCELEEAPKANSKIIEELDREELAKYYKGERNSLNEESIFDSLKSLIIKINGKEYEFIERVEKVTTEAE